MKKICLQRTVVSTVIAGLLAHSSVALADERNDLERLRETTLALINALVESGVLSKDKAAKMMADAEQKAQLKLAESAAPSEVGADGKKVTRVTYVPESMKREIREQVKQEVLAQAKTERWGEPGALPEWIDRFNLEADLRLRYESTRMGNNNTAPGSANFSDGNGLTRAADIAQNLGVTAGGSASPNTNTQDDRNRWRIRARFGAGLKLTDMVSAGFRVGTGDDNSRVSTNQTLNQEFNKKSIWLDRAYVSIKPTETVSLTGGRFANPFVGTDLVWADDLNFEGVSASIRPKLSDSTQLFATAGYFPLQESSPLKQPSRNLVALQAGLDWKMLPKTGLKVSAGVFNFRDMQGTKESNAAFTSAAPDYAVRYEYASNYRQRGNTLFVVNAQSDTDCSLTTLQGCRFGLASKFNELNLTATLDLAQFDPVHVILTADYVRNLAFDRSQIAARTGQAISDGGDKGYMMRMVVGHPTTTKRGQWNVGLAYRYLESDAVLDAFTNSDFGFGGTNNKGYILSANYGIDTNTWLAARWMSASLIDSMVPSYPGSSKATRLNTDLLQVDLNARF